MLIDGKRIYTIGGRLQKAKIMYETEHPVILPNDDPVVILMIEGAHEKMYQNSKLQVSRQVTYELLGI